VKSPEEKIRKRIELVYHLLERHPNGLTEQEIADMLNFERRTVNNYLWEPSAQGKVYKEGHLWIVLPYHAARLRRLDISPEEAMTLYLATRLLVKQHDKRNESAETALVKLAEALTGDLGVGREIHQAALELARRHPGGLPDVCVAIIGGDPSQGKQAENAEMARLHALRAELGIGDLVTFLGAKDQDTLQYYYSAAEMVVMPSHYESFGMVALEAMACGTPVIASEVGGLAFVVRDSVTGFHVPDRDPEALAAKIELLLDDQALRMRLGRRATCWAESYGWPVIADRLLELFQEVAGVQMMVAVGCCNV
jgi:hypothetical protein